MLLTLSAKSIIAANGVSAPLRNVFEAAKWARDELGVSGLTLQTSLFSGWEAAQFDELRDAADKAGAPCLLLVEDQPLCLSETDQSKADASLDRAERVLRVANRLGCSSVAFAIGDPATPATQEAITPRLKAVLSKAERMELNLLLSPAPGITESPDKLTALIRKVGGFRIGSYPDFEAASKASDPVAYLRSLTPYASAVCAALQSFDSKGQHKAYNITAFVEAIQSVGYEAALTLEFRGKGDPVPALCAAKTLIESCLSDEGPEPELEEEAEE